MTWAARQALVGALAGAVLAGCSAQQWYGSGQAWQRQACDRLVDGRERERCLERAGEPYDAYRRSVEAAKPAR
jgi:hypothetical protein